MTCSFAAQLLLRARHFKGGDAMDIPDGWTLEDGGKALIRTITFKDFNEAFSFLARVALYAEKADHHPEFTSVWNRVDFRLTSHDAGGVTDRDLKLAEAIGRFAGD
jgi:4a-hydroxytetrahydrobiopterin dehydratase